MNIAHPGLPDFDYVKPGSLSEASEFLGGTDVFVRMRDGFWPSAYLVDVKHLDGTDELSFDPEIGLTVGAGVNMNRVIAYPLVAEFYPLLIEACRTVASHQLRSRATIVGNICNASPAGDTIGACMVLKGTLTVHGVDGFRQEPLEGFFAGPGETILKAGDIVTKIVFPLPPPGSAGKYLKLGRNAVGDLAIVGVSVFGYPDGQLPSGYRFRIVLASVAPVPLLAKEAEAILANHPINEATIAEAAVAAMDACTPIDDVRGSARYRKLMVRNLTRMAVSQVYQKLTGQA